MKQALLLVLVLACVTAAGCRAWRPTGFHEPEARTVISANFLHTGDDAMDNWLDKPFKIEFRGVPLKDVFCMPPLDAGVTYRLSSLPSNAKPVRMDSPGMTRRQVLWALAHEYHLEMFPLYYNRFPTTIVVRHRPPEVTGSLSVY